MIDWVEPRRTKKVPITEATMPTAPIARGYSINWLIIGEPAK